jgi:DNA (cytosine-5)-methyltransferase 1
MQIPIVDIFAGPGGLGEGFSAFEALAGGRRPFKISVSAEKEANASKTLRLRAFFRQFEPGHVPGSYYDYVAGRTSQPWTEASKTEWEQACQEALQLELGKREDDDRLFGRIRGQALSGDVPWVLIGGPPCQAYSLVGRARNKGIAGYKAEEDSRHFLYRHYLEIIRRFRPAIFVMENVKGILSSRIGGDLVFPKILEDLARPGGKGCARYRVVPLVSPEGSCPTFAANPTPAAFLLKAEMFGVPQARHRVVLLGVREDVPTGATRLMTTSNERYTVADVIRGLPPLRSTLTDQDNRDWGLVASRVFAGAARAAERTQPEAAAKLRELQQSVLRQRDPGSGSRWTRRRGHERLPGHLDAWLIDTKMEGHLNHEVRGHMAADLARYAYAATYASVHGRSPRGAADFPKALSPNHENWKSGKFVDRFKVQLWNAPSSTVTSHLSKDGHYFIHPDPIQLRSLSVREAARLQTFPDNYFFEGPRSAQFQQVGNAVPPWMARGIAAAVHSILVG